MAKLIVDGPDLVVRLSPLEKLGALHRDVRVPLRAVRSVEAESHPWKAVPVELSDESPYEQLLVSVRDAESSVAAIRAATGVYPPSCKQP
jgi:hypothetical protein